MLVPTTRSLLRDAVPNVRFVAAQTVPVIMPYVTRPDVKRDLRKEVEKLQTDPDKDVQYFASKALAGL